MRVVPRSPTLARRPIMRAETGVIRIGDRALYRDDIVGVSVAARTDRDIEGPMINFSVYLLIASLFLLGVVEFSWRSRFLLATGFFGAIALMSLADIFAANRVSYWKLDVTLADGEVLPLAVHSKLERDQLLAMLGPA